jgi:hypothetical protein
MDVPMDYFLVSLNGQNVLNVRADLGGFVSELVNLSNNQMMHRITHEWPKEPRNWMFFSFQLSNDNGMLKSNVVLDNLSAEKTLGNFEYIEELKISFCNDSTALCNM